MQKHNIPCSKDNLNVIGLLMLHVKVIEDITLEVINSYKKPVPIADKQTRVWIYKDVRSNTKVKQLSKFLPYKLITRVITNLVYNKLPIDLTDIGIAYYPTNHVVKIPLIGNVQLPKPFILKPDTEVTKVYTQIDNGTIYLIPVIKPIICMEHMQTLEIPLAGTVTTRIYKSILTEIENGYTIATTLPNDLKLTETYKAIPNSTPSSKYGIKLARDNKNIDKTLLPVLGMDKKTINCFYLKGNTPLYFKRYLTESQLLTLQTYKYNYHLRYNKKRSEYTLVCNKNIEK